MQNWFSERCIAWMGRPKIELECTNCSCSILFFLIGPVHSTLNTSSSEEYKKYLLESIKYEYGLERIKMATISAGCDAIAN